MNYKGYTINVERDEYAESPNDMGDYSMYFLTYDHRQFYVGQQIAKASDVYDAFLEGKKFVKYNEYAKVNYSYWVFPVYAYIHSGVALSVTNDTYPFNDRWDVSFKGFVCINSDMNGWDDKDKAYEVAEGVIKEWNHYLSGDIWYFTITDPNGEEIDSCHGYIGDADYPLEEAKSIVDSIIKCNVKEHAKKLKRYIQAKVPIIYRQPLTIE